MAEVVIKSIDLDDASKETFLNCLKTAYESNKSNPNDIANELKKSLDELLGGPWHIVVGKSYATSISHEKNSFAYVYIDKYAVIAFRTA